MPSSCRVSAAMSSRANSEGRSAAAKPTSSRARSCSPGKVPGIARKAARNNSTTSAVFLRSGRRWSRRIPAKVADTGGEAVGGGVAGEEMQIAQRRVAQP